MNLPERLRALPDYEPPANGWQQLSKRMDARRNRWRMAGGGLALAASVLVAVGLVGLRPDRAPFPSGSTAAARTAPAQVQVAQLVSRSQQLENQLRLARSRVAVWDDSRAYRADVLEHELSKVDARLSYARHAPASPEVEQLWRTRVRLMDALLDLHQNEAPALHYASYQY